MASELISIIIPVYKVEKYLDRCLNSVVSQTYENLEIILVDDGSPDRCPEICDQWAQRDRRIKVIHKPNGGVSSARNVGLEIASGELVSFIDSDDYVPKDSVEQLLKLYWEHGAALTGGSFRFIKTLNRTLDAKYCNHACFGEIFADQVPYILTKMNLAPWAKLFEMSVIRKHSITFPLGIKNGEDSIFIIRYLTYAHSICETSKIVYYYDVTVPNSAIRKYRKDEYIYRLCLYDAQKSFVKKVCKTENEELNKALEQMHFDWCLEHYVLHEKDKSVLEEQIHKTAKAFPLAGKHKWYERDIREENWLNIANEWKRQHKKEYFLATLRIIFHKLRGMRGILCFGEGEMESNCH